MTLKWCMVNVHEVSQRVCDSLREKAKRNVELFNTVPATGLPLMEGDKNRLQQVLYNLVGNGLKFTSRGSVTLSAEVRVAPEDESTGTSLSSREEVVIEVADTGCGIPEEQLANVFKPFTQVDMSGTRHYDGVGLGLCICKEVIEAMHGTITIRSTVEAPAGTVVTIVIPVSSYPTCSLTCLPPASRAPALGPDHQSSAPPSLFGSWN